MKTTIASAALVVCGLAVISTVALPSYDLLAMKNSTQRCEDVLKTTETTTASQQCTAPAEKISWQSWLTGESRSTQFHFFDLVELLFGDQQSSYDKKL
ncbi:hypothetical protein CWI84_11290 [Idiomarina tyrosinivorans]|uniref:Uncharacterized protein n=1 Tax=Idiomarina tyrosinivorans TaxID=1445662 RepID=A0A432ZF29_9GAMM|nr:hypothetical protein [Idiomarina tyrosinivorans]RUO76577.1 hypothetical protein CWI84_11290 [Idiomarina tyrosinivorans]